MCVVCMLIILMLVVCVLLGICVLLCYLVRFCVLFLRVRERRTFGISVSSARTAVVLFRDVV